jgi:predicted hotdog family 3-hydroxylacyl-ACP dehydratase
MPKPRKYTRLDQLAGMRAEEFLQHREPMLLLDTLVESAGEVTVCEFCITEDWLFATPDLGVPAYVGVEIMAQCVAVHAGARARVEGFGPPLGFLLGTRHFKASVDWFDIDNTYRVTCEELFRDTNGMGLYECSVRLHDSPVAAARVSVLEKEYGKRLGV